VFLILWGYFVLCETLMVGQTPGKRALGIRVVRGDGLPIGLREAAIRNLVRAADMQPGVFYLLGGLVAARGARLLAQRLPQRCHHRGTPDPADPGGLGNAADTGHRLAQDGVLQPLNSGDRPQHLLQLGVLVERR
jgi:hypothetical protein